MGIPTFDVDVEIISKLSNYPGAEDGLTPEAFRARFDLAAKLIKEYLNTILIPNLNITTDVDALVEAAQKQLAAVISVELGKYFEKVVQLDDCVLNSGYKFSANKMSDTLIRVYGGEAVVQGHLITFNPEEPVSIAVADGTYGTYRNDLICLRFTRTEDGEENASIVYLQGNASQTVAEDPAYLQHNINVVAAVSTDFPLYRIRVQNTAATLEPLFTPMESFISNFIDEIVQKIAKWEGGSY